MILASKSPRSIISLGGKEELSKPFTLSTFIFCWRKKRKEREEGKGGTGRKGGKGRRKQASESFFAETEKQPLNARTCPDTQN